MSGIVKDFDLFLNFQLLAFLLFFVFAVVVSNFNFLFHFIITFYPQFSPR